MNEVEQQKDVDLQEILESPEVEEDTSKEPSPETTESKTEPKENEEPNRVPYERFKEVNENLKALQNEIKNIKDSGTQSPLSEEEKKELQAKEFIAKAAREEYQRMLSEQDSAERARIEAIEKEVKFYQSIDKDFTEKVAEELADKFGTEKNPLEVETTYKIFREQKELKAQLPSTPKPKVPNSIRSSEIPATVDQKEIHSKSFWELVEEAKQSLRGK